MRPSNAHTSPATPLQRTLSSWGLDDAIDRHRREALDVLLDALRRARFASGLRCVHCSGSRVQRWGTFSGRQRYRCTSCLRTFSDLTGTPLAYCKYPECWRAFTACVRETLSVRACGRRLGIHKDTAWRWRHRLLRALLSSEEVLLTGVVEIDAPQFHRCEKGSRHLARPPFARGVRGLDSGRERVSVLLGLDAQGTVRAEVAPPLWMLSGSLVEEILRKHCEAVETILATRRWSRLLLRFCSATGARHHVIDEVRPVGRPLPPGSAHAYQRRLRSWLRRFRGVATRYLDHYLCWHRFQEANLANPFELLLRACGHPAGCVAA